MLLCALKRTCFANFAAVLACHQLQNADKKHCWFTTCPVVLQPGLHQGMYLPSQIIQLISNTQPQFQLTRRRWIYCCCTCCCNLCKPSPEPMKFIKDRGMTATKVIACLMALGVLASGCFGMANTGPHLVNQAVSTVGTFTVSSNLLPPHKRPVKQQPHQFAQSTSSQTKPLISCQLIDCLATAAIGATA